jgi:hypothetical protein
MFFIRFDFFNWGVTNAFPPDVVPHGQRSVADLPILLATVVPQNRYWLGGFIVLAVFTVGALSVVWRDRALDARARFSVGFLALLCLANLYGMVVSCALLLLLMGWLRPRDARSSGVRALVLVGLASAGFWSAFLWNTTGWHALFDDFQDQARFRKMLIALVDYPLVYDKVIDKYLAAIPAFTVMAAGFLGVGLWFALFGKDERLREGFRFLLFLIILHVVLVGILTTPYKSTRYTYFLFPLVLLLSVASMKVVISAMAKHPWRGAAFAACLISWLVLSEDFDVYHLSHMDSKEVYYRFHLGPESERAAHYYRRYDFRSASESINRNRGESDLVVSVFLLAPDFFLDRLDYVYRSHTLEQFHRNSRCSGTQEAWTNKELIHSSHVLYELLEHSERTVWVMAYSDAAEGTYAEEKHLAKRLAAQRFYTTDDGMISVYRIAPGTKPAAIAPRTLTDR